MAPMISAANVIPKPPDLSWRRRLVAEDLRHIQDPGVMFEHQGVDSDGVVFYVYTVVGWLNGQQLGMGGDGNEPGGCTVGGDAILVKASSREEADALACLGLHDTILALDAEEQQYQEAAAALARLSTISPVERLEQATKPASDKSDAFVDDVDAIRPLIGDDIVMAAGRVH